MLVDETATRVWNKDTAIRLARAAKKNSAEEKKKRRQKAHRAAIELEGAKRGEYGATGAERNLERMAEAEADAKAADAATIDDSAGSAGRYGVGAWEAAEADLAKAKKASAAATLAAGGLKRSGRVRRCSVCKRAGHSANSPKCFASELAPELDKGKGRKSKKKKKAAASDHK
eukprot:g5560.t1